MAVVQGDRTIAHFRTRKTAALLAGPDQADYCTVSPVVTLTPGATVHVFILVENSDNVAGVQTALEWDGAKGWDLIDFEGCMPGQLFGSQPDLASPNGGPVDGLILTSFPCVISTGCAVPIARVTFMAGNAGCVDQVEPLLGPIQVVGCVLGVDEMLFADPERLGSVCANEGGRDACVYPRDADLDGDGYVTLSDLMILQQCLVGTPLPECDIDCSGGVNECDLTVFQCQFVGGGPECCDDLNHNGIPDLCEDAYELFSPTIGRFADNFPTANPGPGQNISQMVARTDGARSVTMDLSGQGPVRSAVVRSAWSPGGVDGDTGKVKRSSLTNEENKTMYRFHSLMHYLLMTVLAAAMPVAAAGVDALNAVEDINSPDIPAPPHEPGPRWGGPDRVTLYDNGEMIPWCNTTLGDPCPCPGPPPGAESQIDITAVPPHTYYGYGNQHSLGYRIADDFTIPAGESWSVTSFTFFQYQTGSTTQSTIDFVSVRIWDGPPGQPGSTIICGDTQTNLLLAGAWSGIYRTASSSSCATNRPVMAITVAVPDDCPDCPGFPGTLNLPSGTYWLDWDCGGTLSSGPWAPPFTPDVAAPDQSFNALQFQTSWGPPSEPCEFPFIIEGDSCGGGNVYQVPGDFPTVQLAIDNVSNGDIIELADGTYTGDGNRDIDFLGKAITVRSQSGNRESCVIDCQASESEPHFGVRFVSGEGPSSRLENITIRNGFTTIRDNEHPVVESLAGGIFCFQSSPIISGCDVEYCGNKPFFPRFIEWGPRPPWWPPPWPWPPLPWPPRPEPDPPPPYAGGISIFEGGPLIEDCRITENWIDVNLPDPIPPYGLVAGGIAMVPEPGTATAVGCREGSAVLQDLTVNLNAARVEAPYLPEMEISPSLAMAGGVACAGRAYRPQPSTIVGDCIFQQNSLSGNLMQSAFPDTIIHPSLAGGLALSMCDPTFTGSLRFEENRIEIPLFPDPFRHIAAAGGMSGAGGVSVNCPIVLIENDAEWHADVEVCLAGGASFVDYSAVEILFPLIWRNTAIKDGAVCTVGGGLAFLGTTANIENGTLAENHGHREGGGAGSGLALGESSTVSTITMQNSIIAFGTVNDGMAVACDATSSATLSCCDVFGNQGGDWTGCLEGQLGGTNISENPFFCSPEQGDFTIAEISACAPGNSPPGCGLIGALPVACSMPECPCDADLDGDGYVTLHDLTILQQCLAGPPLPECDIDCSGGVDECDLTVFQCQFVGGGPECCDDLNHNGIPDLCEDAYELFSPTIGRFADNFPIANPGPGQNISQMVARTDGAHSVTMDLSGPEMPLRWVRSDTAFAYTDHADAAVYLRFRVIPGPCQPNLAHPFFMTYPPNQWHAARMDTARSHGTGEVVPGSYMTCFHDSEPMNGTYWTGVPPAVEPCDDILPDGLFTPGTRVQYFFELRGASTGGLVATFPTGLGHTPIGTDEIYKTLWLETGVLPEVEQTCDGTYTHNLLIVNDFADDDVPGLATSIRETLSATLSSLGLEFDIYDHVGSNHAASYDGIGRREDRMGQQPRPPYNGATQLMLEGYDCIWYYSGLSTEATLSDRITLSFFGGQPSQDQQSLSTWLQGCSGQDQRLLVVEGLGWASDIDVNTANGPSWLADLGVDVLASDYAEFESDYRRNARVTGTALAPDFNGEIFGSGCHERLPLDVFGEVAPGEPVVNFVNSLEDCFDPVNCADDVNRPSLLSVVRKINPSHSCERSAAMSFPFTYLLPLDCANEDEGELGNYVINGDNAELLIDLFQGACSINSSPISVVEQTAGGPPKSELYPAVPNPANPSTRIRYTVSERGPVSLNIYDQNGRLIRRLVHEVQDPGDGPFEVTWDGVGDDGRPVASGVFFCELRVAGHGVSRKVVILR